MKNDYEIIGDVVFIYAVSKTHGERVLVVDLEDFHKLDGLRVGITVQKGGYSFPHVTVDRKKVKVSRILRPTESGYCVDHINGNPFDETSRNTRIVSDDENRANMPAKNYHKAVVGGHVYYRVSMKIDGKVFHIFNTNNEPEAKRFGKLLNKFKKLNRAGVL